MENSVSKMTYRNTYAQVQRPRGEILPGSPVLFPVLFLCEEPVLFKYNVGSRKLQHLSDRHSIIVTWRATTTTNAANSNHRNAHFILIYAAFFPCWYLYSVNV